MNSELKKGEITDNSLQIAETELSQEELEALEEKRKAEEKERLQYAIDNYGQFDRKHVWAFVAGQYSQDFRGNPKYLFAYINNYRKDIAAYWLCLDEDTINTVRELGFHACQLNTPEAQYMINRTGVLVAEQVKMEIPAGLEDAVYLNLWHGVGGVKAVERSINSGRLLKELAKKYIKRTSYYQTHQLYVAPSPLIESIAIEQLGLSKDKIIKAGYPRCLYQKNYKKIETYDHDILGERGLPADTRIAVYFPTYRNEDSKELFMRAIPDMEALINVCEQEHILMVFKMHPLLENEFGFLQAKESFKDSKWVCFWDNSLDFYEIIDKVDLAIMDYSSMFTDFISVGVKHFLRYCFDFSNDDLEFPLDYDEATLGRKCLNFAELLGALRDYENDDLTEDIERIKKLYWEYSDENTFETIISGAMAFEPETKEDKTLYSFDVFDTLISRKVLDPFGIFYRVQERITEDGDFPYIFKKSYAQVRNTAEFNVREYYSKSKDLRKSEATEVTFDEIFDRLAYVYSLSQDQINKLKSWEFEAELESVIPLKPQIDTVKELLKNKEDVVLISDMYLPKSFIQKLLFKADPVLAELPLFVSNEYGVLKTSQLLYLEVYKSIKPYYNYDKWVHTGDTDRVDIGPPRKINISARKISKPEYSEIQKELIKNLDSYDAYLVTAMQARLCSIHRNPYDSFVISYVALCFVPYIDWVLRDAARRGYETLYFVSRDGHHLKRIADKIIEARGLNFKTKYIYASRRTWRIPSFVHEIDDGFWEDYGSFGDIVSKDKLLSAMDLTESEFCDIFPSIDLDNINFYSKREMNSYKELFKSSDEYRTLLLQKAAQEREISNGYLRQAMDPDENFVIVEYYGRGYTQDCFVNLWRDIVGKDVDVPFYYSRSVLPTANGAVRYNFTTNNSKQFFIESIFANMPYKSIQEYKEVDGKYVPVIEDIPYNKELFASMNTLLPVFAYEYAKLDLLYPEDTDRMLYDFVFDYYKENLTNRDFADDIGKLVDSVALYGNKREFAPPFTEETLDQFRKKLIARSSGKLTHSITMSVVRSSEEVKDEYMELFQILPGENLAGGRLLSEKEIEKNREFRDAYDEIITRTDRFNRFYEEAVTYCEIKDKIVLLSEADKLKTNRIDMIHDAIKKQAKYRIKVILLGNAGTLKDKEVANEIASARFVIITEPLKLLCRTNLRDGTDLILANATTFALFNRGMQKTYSLKWQKKYEQLIGSNDISIMQIPSRDREGYFKACYGARNDVKTDLLGCYQSDLYFDDEYKRTAEKKLLKLFPEAAFKKRILYIPRWRTRADCKEWLNIIDLELLKEYLGNDYVVIMWFNKNQVARPVMNTMDIQGFSKYISKGMALRELMVCADIVVGDYNDTFFEVPIIRKPAFSTAYDYENYVRMANMSFNANSFEKFIFCPIVHSAKELADQIKDIDNYDYTDMDRFRDTYLSGCDGHSTNRIVEYVMEAGDSVVPDAASRWGNM